MRGNIGVEFDHMNVETQRYIERVIFISEVVIFTLFISTRTLPKIPKESKIVDLVFYYVQSFIHVVVLHSSDKTRNIVYIEVVAHRKLQSLLPGCTLVDVGKVTARQRMIKSKEEIEVGMI